jgi:hypothetical protein
MLIDKLNITRLDAMQRKLVRQIESGFQALQEELDEAKERLRIATEKLYQQEVTRWGCTSTPFTRSCLTTCPRVTERRSGVGASMYIWCGAFSCEG